MSSRRRIDIVIDRLVVRGVGRRQARAIERELRSRLEELAQGWLDGTAPLPAAGQRRPDGQLTLASAPGDRLGRDVADAVFASITAPTTTTAPMITPARPPRRPDAPDRTATEGGPRP